MLYVKYVIFPLAFVSVGLLTGCAHYKAPKAAADLSVFSAQKATEVPPADAPPKPEGDVEFIDRKPMAKFPAHLVTVRVQESGYQSYTTSGYGTGRYSVVTTHDIEKDEDFERLAALPDIAQISPVSRLLLPAHFDSDKELRTAAARMQADMVLIYTVDTAFFSKDASTPLSIISLGLSPTIQVRVVSTVSSVLMDTRSGYIYGTAERTYKAQQAAAFLTTQNAFDQLRLETERKAFEQFLDEFGTLWKAIARDYRR